jgi:hypothetical protein
MAGLRIRQLSLYDKQELWYDRLGKPKAGWSMMAEQGIILPLQGETIFKQGMIPLARPSDSCRSVLCRRQPVGTAIVVLHVQKKKSVR